MVSMTGVGVQNTFFSLLEITKQFTRSVKTKVAVASVSLFKFDCHWAGGVRKLMIRDKNPFTKIRVFLSSSAQSTTALIKT